MMKQFKASIVTVAMVAFATFVGTSCKPEDVAGPSLEVSRTEIELPFALSEANFEVTSNGKWTVASDKEWCEIKNPTDGNGNENSVVIIRAKANSETISRVATVTVISGTVKKEVKVTQAAFSNITLSEDARTVNYDDLKVSFDLTSLLPWTLVESTLPAWITTSTTKGVAGKTTIELTLSQNDDDYQRSAAIAFGVDGTKDVVTFNLKQYGTRGDRLASDSMAIVAIFKCIDFPDYAQLDVTQPLSKWPGVTVALIDREYRVVGLNIPSVAQYFIPGTGGSGESSEILNCWRANTPIPEDIGYLTELTKFNAGMDMSLIGAGLMNTPIGISGALPEGFGKLTKLTSLTIRENKFTSLPASLKNLVNLTVLDVSNNQLSGDVPSYIGDFNQLTYLNISRNNFAKVPEMFGKLTLLKTLDMSRLGVWSDKNATNEYNETCTSSTERVFPSSLLQLKALHDLNVSYCNMGGPIPTGINKIEELWYFKANNNKFTGNIPTTMTELYVVAAIDLSYNQLDGGIPKGFEACQTFQIFRVMNNKLTGALPSSFGACRALYDVQLSNNNFTGPITNEFMSASYITLLLDGNDLTGDMPSNIEKQTRMTTLDISGNNITSIHPLIGKSKTLKILAARDNQITSIPVELGAMAISYLDLANNQIAGTLDNTLGSMSLLKNLFLSGNKLTGVIPENLLKRKLDWTNICPQTGVGFSNCPVSAPSSNRRR